MPIKFHVLAPEDRPVSTLGKYLVVSKPDDRDMYIVPAKFLPTAVPYYVEGELVGPEDTSGNFAMMNILVTTKNSILLALTKSPTLAYFQSRNDWTVRTAVR